MTVGEAVMSCCDGDFFDEAGFVLGIDMSENGDSLPDEFTAVTEGVCRVSAKLAPRVIIRDYVDGDRAVPISRNAEIKLRFLIIGGDPVQEKILSAAKSGIPLRCVYMSCGGSAFDGNMLISVSETYPAEIYGIETLAVFSAC